MQPDEHARMYRAETEHFWFVGTRRVILAALQDALDRPLAGARLLDIGCGTGFTLSLLPPSVDAVGLDYAPAALAYAAQRAPNARFVRGSAYALPLADASFDAVLALDVLEHLDHDDAALSEIARVLRPGGVAILTVPAFAFLWSGHDEALEHRRRYRLPDLEAVVHRTGLRVQHATHYNSVLFPAVALARLVGRARAAISTTAESAGSDLSLPPRPINTLLARILGGERHFALKHRIPFGVSCLVVARRP